MWYVQQIQLMIIGCQPHLIHINVHVQREEKRWLNFIYYYFYKQL